MEVSMEKSIDSPKSRESLTPPAKTTSPITQIPQTSALPSMFVESAKDHPLPPMKQGLKIVGQWKTTPISILQM